MTEANKTVVRRLVDEVLNGGHLEVIDELFAPELAEAARRWIAPFRASFPDVHMEVVELIAEGDKVVGRFTCSATHLGEWLGQAPTGRRFERVDEVSILRVRDGRIVHVWSLEDTLGRLQQLGLASERAARLDRHGPNRIGAMRLFSQDTKVQALKGVPLFDGLSRKELLQLERVCEDLEVEPGKVLCSEGETGHEFFVIVDGKVRITRKGAPVATLSSGDFLGEIALVTEMQRTATATADTPVRLFVMTRREFDTVLDQNPKVERKVLRALARRLAKTSSDPTLA